MLKVCNVLWHYEEHSWPGTKILPQEIDHPNVLRRVKQGHREPRPCLTGAEFRVVDAAFVRLI